MTKDNSMPWKIATGIFALLFIATLLNTNIFSGTGTTATTQQQAQPTAADMTLYSDDVVRGSADAKVTIIEYSDPSCPYCAAAAGGTQMVAYMKGNSPNYEPAVPGIMTNYVDTGKARIVFRYFPGHGAGQKAMEALLCANEQGKFWELSDIYFNNQDKNLKDNQSVVVDLAKQVSGLDTTKLDACITTNGAKYEAKMTADAQKGQAMGVQGTPAFFVNGELVSGAQPYSALKTVIDAKLA